MISWNRLLWRRGKIEEELEKELRFHLDQHVEDLVTRGFDPAEARRQARIALGGMEQVKEGCRDTWRVRLLLDAIGDVRFGARWLCKSPAFALSVITLLALGIGANTAIFSLVNAILLRTLPIREPNRLVLFELQRSNGTSYYMIPQTIYRQLRDNNTVLDGFAAATFPPVALSDAGSAERVNGLLVSGSFFETLGVDAALGRVLTPDDDRLPVSPAVCVISYRLWERRFGKDPGVIGHKVQVNAHPFTIVGVTRKEFEGLSEDAQLDISIPLTAEGMSDFFLYPVRTFGRLKKDVSASQARASLDILYHQVAPRIHSGKPANVKVILRPGSQGFSALKKQYENPLLILMAMVGLVLLIACANITNLLMARISGRAKEMAVRLAVGAGRMRLARQLLAENALLIMSGTVLGIALAYVADHALLVLAPRQIGGGELNLDVNPDWRVLLFAVGVAMLVGLICGIAPAVQCARVDPGPALKGVVGLRIPGRISFTSALVVAQVALSLVLLTGAGLFLRSLHNLRSVDPGLNPEHLVLLTIDPGLSGYSSTATNQLAERLVERAHSIPGVVAASPGFISPLSGGIALTHISVAGYQPRADEPDSFDVNWIGPEYFEVLGTPLLRGRVFTQQDGRTNRVAIVNEKTAQHFWPNESPIGKHAVVGGDECEIIGVVKDVKSESLRQDARPIVCLPFARNTHPHIVLHVRVAGATTPVIPALLGEIRALDPNLPVLDATTMAAQLSRSLTLDRLMASLTSVFGFLAVAVAAVGLYGVMAFAVSARTREIAIRMALGANYSSILAQVMAQGAVLAAVGITLGVPSALVASRSAASFLYGLSVIDPTTYVVLALLLAVVTLSATWIPARRAAMVDPMVALRYE